LTQHPSAQASPVNVPGAAVVQAQLERIVSSVEFRKSARMCRFLRVVTQEALSGNLSSLKEYRIGTEVFDKDESFDPRLDPIVRNEARRLRRKLEMYYLVEGRSDPVLIELPKGGYIPVFAFRNAAREPVIALSPGRWWLFIGAVAILVLGIAAWLAVGPKRLLPHTERAARGSPAAEAYALGRHLLFKLTPDDIRASRTHFETAIRLDPQFAEAYAALALNYQASVVFGLVPREPGIVNSRELADKAAKLSRGGASAEAALGGHEALLEENYTRAARHFERALSIDPNDAAVHAQYAVTLLLQLGKVDDARRAARRANELDPQNGLASYALVLTDYCARDYRSAVAHAQEALRRQPDSALVPGLLIDSYLAMGSFDDAWFFVEKGGADLDVYRALIRGMKGERRDALRAGRKRVEDDAAPLLTARLFAAGADRAAALHWLEEADRRHDIGARISARYAPDFDAMRPLPDFAALLGAMTRPRL
jgi:tetratricopeptide (TPR) repeat protein